MIIRKLRIEKGWSQEQLAEMAGVSSRTIQRTENGYEVSTETMKCLAAVFEIDFDYLGSGPVKFVQFCLKESV